jgi:hypothetical protein
MTKLIVVFPNFVNTPNNYLRPINHASYQASLLSGICVVDVSRVLICLVIVCKKLNRIG